MSISPKPRQSSFNRMTISAHMWVVPDFSVVLPPMETNRIRCERCVWDAHITLHLCCQITAHWMVVPMAVWKYCPLDTRLISRRAWRCAGGEFWKMKLKCSSSEKGSPYPVGPLILPFDTTSSSAVSIFNSLWLERFSTPSSNWSLTPAYPCMILINVPFFSGLERQCGLEVSVCAYCPNLESST